MRSDSVRLPFSRSCLFVEFADLPKKVVVSGDSLLNVPDHAILFDEESNPAPSVLLTQISVLVGNQRKGNVVLTAEIIVGLQTV